MAVGVAALLAACAGTKRRRWSDDGSGWQEVTSAHFILRTNLPSGVAEQAARDLERLREALVVGAFRLPADPPGRLKAVLLRDAAALEEFVDRRVDGYVTSTPEGPLLVSSGADLTGEGRSKLLHELAHYLSSFVLLRQPRWYAEGVAEYAESLQVQPGGVRLGGLHPENFKILQEHGALPMEELWYADEPGGSAVAFSSHFYASSWAWFRFFDEKYPARLRAFEQMMARAENPTEAFATAFSSTRLGKLEDELEKYLGARRFAVKFEPVRYLPIALGTRALSRADIHALRAELFLESPALRSADDKRALAQWEVAQALKRDPHNVGAVVLQAAFQTPEQRLLAARELVRARPREGRAWTFLAGELESDPSAREERAAALEKAARLSPEDAVALNNLAWEKVTRGDAALGLELAERAIRIVPWSPAMLDTYAAALFKVGRCVEARIAEERAVSLLYEEVAPATRQQLLASLMQYRAKCPAIEP